MFSQKDTEATNVLTAVLGSLGMYIGDVKSVDTNEEQVKIHYDYGDAQILYNGKEITKAIVQCHKHAELLPSSNIRITLEF